jgi:hypothetical protein
MYPRTAYFLDLDNLVGTGQPSANQIHRVLDEFERLCKPCRGDQVFCAGTAISAYHCADYRPNYRVAVGRGKDGADRRLLELGDPEHVSRRFQRVVIGSGDGIFAGLALEYMTRGIQVELLVGKGALANNLHRACKRHIRDEVSKVRRLPIAA